MRKRPNPSTLSLEELKRRGDQAIADMRDTIQQARQIVSAAQAHEEAVASGFNPRLGRARRKQEKSGE